MTQIAVDLIKQGKNPRVHFDAAEQAELRESIRAQGLLQPILVRPLPEEDGYFELVAGERRLRAVRELGHSQIEAVVKELSQAEAHAAALTENIVRADMSAAEEAEAAQVCVLRHDGDREEAARALGWPQDKLNKRLRLMACAPEVRQALTDRRILVGHAELLAAVRHEQQVKVLARIIEGNLSVEYLKANVTKIAHRLDTAIFDTEQCTKCPHNSTKQAGLFDTNIGAGYCTNPEHYDQLTREQVEAIAAEQREHFPKVVVYRAEDAFKPLPLTAGGPLGVGTAQAQACRGCANFGCAISAVAGSQGEITAELCFDASCNAKKVAARIGRRAQGIDKRQHSHTRRCDRHPKGPHARHSKTKRTSKGGRRLSSRAVAQDARARTACANGEGASTPDWLGAQQPVV